MKQFFALILIVLLMGCAKTMVKVTWQDAVQKPDGTVVAFPEKLILLQRPWGDSWALFEPAEEDSCDLPRIMTSGGTLSKEGLAAIIGTEALIMEGIETYMTSGANKGLKVLKGVAEEDE